MIMSNIKKESVEKDIKKRYDTLENKVDNLSITLYSNRFDNIISTTNQSPKLEPIKEAIRRKFDLDIKPSFFGLPKDSYKYKEILSEYNKEIIKERQYLKKVLDKIVDEKYKRTQDYFNKLTNEQKKRLFIDNEHITLYRGYTSEGIALESEAGKQIHDIMDNLSMVKK